MRSILVNRIDAQTRTRLVMVSSETLLVEVADRLSDMRISLVVVCDSGGVMVGVITKTNIVQQIARSCQSIGAAVASEVMTRLVTSCRLTDSLFDVLSDMERLGLTHMPVIGDDGKPTGVVNAGDALRALMADEKYDAALLRDYVMGIGYQ